MLRRARQWRADMPFFMLQPILGLAGAKGWVSSDVTVPFPDIIHGYRMPVCSVVWLRPSC